MTNLAFGASATISAADYLRAGGTILGWFQPAQQSASALWFAGAPMLGLSLILYGLVIRAAAALPSWAGWLAAAARALKVAGFAPREAPRHS
jgi:hypothetical protein